MTWVDDMKRDAVSLVSPDFDLEPDDRIEMETDFREGYRYSTVTWDSESFSVELKVYRKNEIVLYKTVDGPEEVERFFRDLMQKGSEHYA